MEYRKLGGTDLQISLLGFGAAPLGNVYGDIDRTEGKRAVHLAIEKGINFFDVSPYYGLTLAEERLGESLGGHRHKVVLATKCGRYGLDQFDFSAKRVTASMEESLKRLQTDYIDLFLAHDVEFGDAQQIIEETVPALRKLQRQGKARFIGITGFPLGTLAKIAEAIPVDAILSYCRYNLMVSDMDDVLTPVAKKRGIGLINASPLHMGVLTNQGPPEWHPAPAAVRDAGKKVAALCRKRGLDVSPVALRFCLDHPYVSSTLVGMATPQQVESNLHALKIIADPNLIREIPALLGPVHNIIWPSGRAENHELRNRNASD
jgi:L-galactose dehydrogenase